MESLTIVLLYLILHFSCNHIPFEADISYKTLSKNYLIIVFFSFLTYKLIVNGLLET